MIKPSNPLLEKLESLDSMSLCLLIGFVFIHAIAFVSPFLFCCCFSPKHTLSPSFFFLFSFSFFSLLRRFFPLPFPSPFSLSDLNPVAGLHVFTWRGTVRPKEKETITKQSQKQKKKQPQNKTKRKSSHKRSRKEYKK